MSKRLVGVVLGAIFATFLSWPALAVDDHYFSAAGNDANAPNCAIGTPCLTVAQANTESGTANPGDRFLFNRDDTFNDAALTPAASGSAGGGHIEFLDYGTGAKPIFGNTTINNAVIVGVGDDYIQIENLALTGGTDGTADGHILDVRSDNFIALNIDIDGTNQISTGGACIWLDEPTNVTIDGFTIVDCNFAGIGLIDGQGVSLNYLIKNGTIGCVGLGTSSDGIGSENDSGDDVTFEDIVIDMTGCAAGTEDAIDLKAGDNWVFTRITVIDEAVLIHEGAETGTQTSVVFNELITGESQAARHLVFIDDPIFVCNRCIFNSTDTTGNPAIETSSVAGDIPTLTFNASVFYAPVGSPTAEALLHVRGGAVVTITNSTFIGRNTNTLLGMIEVHADYVGAGITLKNNIFDSDATTTLIIDGNATVTWTLDNNLYWSLNGGTWIDDDGTTHNEAAVTSTFDTSGSITEDPLFVNTVVTSDLFLMLGPGSPGIGLGDAANLYAGATSDGDLFGYPFRNLTPNAGARAHRWRTKFPRFGIIMEINPIEPMEEEETVSIWPMSLECECETPEAVNDNWPLALECECVQAAR